MSIRVLVADDQALVRSGFRMVVAAHDDMTVVGEAGDGAEAAALTSRLDPDVVLMDVRMPRTDGIEATRQIVATAPRSRVLILTTFDLDEYAFAALRAGASGFLLKDAPTEELAAAIRAVAAGDAVVAPSVTRRLLDTYAHRLPQTLERHSRHEHPALEALTPRERDVLIEIAAGYSNAEIAQRLVLAEATVKTHVRRILSKLELRDRVQAVVFAYQIGLARP
jgi:DNA-binding NarL/FixJ family response regulator